MVCYIRQALFLSNSFTMWIALATRECAFRAPR
jgi:hypothetical protein